jgi:hypothetical protein
MKLRFEFGEEVKYYGERKLNARIPNTLDDATENRGACRTHTTHYFTSAGCYATRREWQRLEIFNPEKNYYSCMRELIMAQMIRFSRYNCTRLLYYLNSHLSTFRKVNATQN